MDWIDTLTRLLVAVAAGAVVGLEREVAGKAAGFRTNILICLGSALMTVVGLEMSRAYAAVGDVIGDPTRVAAGVITGIGFLGAGTIIQQRASVRGLTTAATIWVLAAIGVAAGGGYLALAGVTTLLTVATLYVLEKLERWMSTPDSTIEYQMRFEGGRTRLEAVREAARRGGLSTFGMKVRARDGDHLLTFTARGTAREHDELMEALSALGEVAGEGRSEEAE